jgi:hypothetical protein
MSDLRELTADELNAVAGGCRPPPPNSIVAPNAGFTDTPPPNPNPVVATHLTLYALPA